METSRDHWDRHLSTSLKQRTWPAVVLPGSFCGKLSGSLVSQTLLTTVSKTNESSVSRWGKSNSIEWKTDPVSELKLSCEEQT